MERFKCFSVKIIDYYNITVHSLVCNKLNEKFVFAKNVFWVSFFFVHFPWVMELLAEI